MMFKKMGKSLLKNAREHKIVATIIVLLVALIVYRVIVTVSATDTQVSYTYATVEKGTLVASVSGTGQVSASNQVDLSAKVSGDVVSVNVQDGQEVKKGTVIARLNSSVAQKSVRDAQIALENAQLSLQKMQEPVATSTLLQAENAFISAQETATKADTTLQQSYQDALTTIGEILPNLSSVLTSILSRNDPNQWAGTGWTYSSLLEQYNANVTKYQDVNRSSSYDALTDLLDVTYTTVRAFDLVTKNTGDTVLVTKVDGYFSDISTTKRTIETNTSANLSAQRSVVQQQAALEKVKEGTDEWDIKAQELAVQQRKNALADAREKLADYIITAPFDGVIVNLSVHAGDSIASINSYGSIATLLTKDQIAEVSLNEVDIPKVKIGQKATLTFDAIDEVEAVGEVTGVDPIGAVSQGVVSYTVKVAFNAQDKGVKPGMSTTVNIITDIHQDVLVVPNAAIKKQNGQTYVQIIEKVSLPSSYNATGTISGITPTRQNVSIGDADDSITEIISGLSQGDIIITQTASSSQASSSKSSSTKLGGMGGIGGPMGM